MKTMAQIGQFFDQALPPGLVVDVALQGLSNHTHLLQKGWGFVALAGSQKHGADYWTQAKAQGATCVLSDREIADCDLPVLLITNLANRLAELANWFYDFPSRHIKVIGVTGTNGKTSTTHYIAQLLDSQAKRVGLIGTLGNGEFGQLSETANTTPDILVVQGWLAKFVTDGLDYAVMEVSSHGLALGRITGVEFACVALTQVTRDHLDFHLDVADYQNTKKRLFRDYVAQKRVLNLDDSIGRSLVDEPHSFGYSLKNPAANLVCESLELSPQGLQGRLVYQNQTYVCQTGLMGAFNAENLLCALSCLVALEFELKNILTSLTSLKPVTGRMQPVTVPAKAITVLVDYAHTPDALEQVLLGIRAHLNKGQLWVVFGCGGDRDKGKRPLMGEVAERLADQLILTSDNPRTENPQNILRDIQQGLSQPAIQIESRQAAIEWALSQSQAGDLILVAGKGHEQTQEINGVKHPFSDQKVIEQWHPS
ncbi:MAG: UDP-N-acetylmuramoyl-L-alanyl-D-glutamate--2,6-diaminopimelate ligase [Thiomicrospira sp.]|uniref:UDP-N-acetylmuramoyl-L-alanyl-D-glutamate--2, 6-diaminopimelate ligase n=1 Tax=Thiomicrospira sp. TaxID=935 RepID=UPI0019EB8C09|nr:UDP-N-acetylmuramoyl-L-alanyl-D-glutamate--2,6-diaminopimelate ligase [Thiomicrospira sp.]MBE0493102.1 UDP-N-acetylmuramoyl-L-alanyl-D-glutamate--2,6-diaminopimelate ligase [Thiomicrospira sp.]